ncbi:hypothetical protein ACFVAV_18265 [Nocardia sp. NPDC057663]
MLRRSGQYCNGSAEWWRPELGIGIDALADTYATFARNLLG